jgi:uncharacterized tellurite resistance protein B-like protein
MKLPTIDTANQNINFQMGLLHFAHLLMTVDGVIDERERLAIKQIIEEENIPEIVFADFQDNVVHKTEKQVYEDAVEFLNECSEHEKLCALVHLYQLSQADEHIHEKEVKLILFALDGTKVDFEDVELTARLVSARKTHMKK